MKTLFFSLLLLLLGGSAADAAGLKGTYTIDPSKAASGTNFRTIQSAIDSLNKNYTSGTCRFRIADGLYREKLTWRLKSAWIMDSIIFESASGDSSKVVLRSNGTVLDLAVEYLPYFEFKGVTFSSDSNHVVQLDTTDAVFKNCVFRSKNTTYNLVNVTELTYGATTTTFANCLFKKGNWGFNMSSKYTSGNSFFKIKMSKCLFDSCQGSMNITADYMGSGGQLYPNVDESWLNDLGTGVNLGGEVTGTFNRNHISGAVALRGEECSTTCINNIILKSVTARISYLKFYHNTVLGDLNLSYHNLYSAYTVQNNIVSGGLSLDETNALYNKQIVSVSDYNDFLGNSFYIAYYDGTTFSATTLKTWQDSVGSDKNSLAIDPKFSTLIKYMPTNSLLDNKGNANGITIDYYGQSRSTTKPDMGAVEFVGCLAPSARANDTSVTACLATVTLKATGASRYRWYNAPAGGTLLDTNAAFTVSLSKTSLYYVAGLDGNCESARDTVNVIFTNTATAAKATDTTVCAGMATIAATGATNYRWYTEAIGGAPIDTNKTISLSFSQTDTLYVSGHNGICESERERVIIKVNPLPVADAGVHDTICAGASVAIGSAVKTGNTYAWTSNPSGFTSSTANPGVSPAATTTYYLTETTSAKCSSRDSVTITVLAKPATTIRGNTTICAGTTASYMTTKNATSAYIWKVSGGTVTNGAGTDSVTVRWNLAGTRTLQVKETNSAGCADSALLTVTVHPTPTAAWKATDLGGRKYIFTATDTTQAGYFWTFGDGGSDTIYKATHSYLSDSTYTVSLHVMTAAGCTAKATDTLQVRLTTLAELKTAVDFGLSIFPNPFRESTRIHYSLPDRSLVKLEIIDGFGRVIAQPVNGKKEAGEHSYLLQPEQFMAGTYLVRLTVNGQPMGRTVICVK